MAVDPNNLPEQELIEECIAQNRQCQEFLYRKYADKMYNVSLSYAKDEDEACDILQEGFIKVFRNLTNFNQNGSFQGWIRRIIVNTALEHFRKKNREREHLSVYHKFIEPRVENILNTLHAQEIIRLVNQLPAKAAMVLKLYAIEGYSHKEIAGQLEITEGTSKSQLNRARSLLKDSIKNNENIREPLKIFSS